VPVAICFFLRFASPDSSTTSCCENEYTAQHRLDCFPKKDFSGRFQPGFGRRFNPAIYSGIPFSRDALAERALARLSRIFKAIFAAQWTVAQPLVR
jgi:hypothetical protein